MPKRIPAKTPAEVSYNLPGKVKDGYIIVSSRNHPSCFVDGVYRRNLKRRFLHVILLEQSIGRFLGPDECCHHIDGNKLNNSVDNLMLMNRRWHSILHNPSSDIRVCPKCGGYKNERSDECKSCWLKASGTTCVDCGKRMEKGPKRCLPCERIRRKNLPKRIVIDNFCSCGVKIGYKAKSCRRCWTTSDRKRELARQHGLGKKASPETRHKMRQAWIHRKERDFSNETPSLTSPHSL